jgi:hypothetical protein
VGNIDWLDRHWPIQWGGKDLRRPDRPLGEAMKRRFVPAFWLICAGVPVFASARGTGIATAGSLLALSLPRAGLSADQWVGQYHCVLRGIRIVAIREVPYIWFTQITNEKGGRAEIDAGHVLGTGPMGKDPIEDLQNIVLLQRVGHGKSVSVNCRLGVENFHSDDTRFVNFDTKQFSIKPIDRIPSSDPPYEPGLKRFALSVPPFALADHERIVMFEVEIKAGGGRVVSLKNIPALWFVGATNSDSGSFNGVYGETLADSAALGKNDLSTFDRFLTLEWHADDAVDVKVKIKIKTAPKRHRYVRFNTRQVIMTPVSYSGKRTHQAPLQ